jgi:hypothetical protein
MRSEGVRKKTQAGPIQLDLPFGTPSEAAGAEAAPGAEATPGAETASGVGAALKAAAAEAPRAEAPQRAVAQAAPARTGGLRVIQGGGQRVHEKLQSRDAVVRVLVEAGADLLLRRITPERAEHIEKAVDHILHLFDRVDDVPQMMPVLQRKLDDLEALMTETRSLRRRQG